MAPEALYREDSDMQLIIAICYPDGEPPDCQERFLYYDDEFAAERFNYHWSERSPIYLFVEQGVVGCEFVDFTLHEGDEKDQIQGEYAMIIVQETDFIPLPPKARFH